MTAFKRGNVILVKFPYSDLIRYKKRPALVVQDETVNTGLSQRVVVQITSNLERTGVTRVLVKKDSPDGQSMGVLSDSIIVADHLPPFFPGKSIK
jgi:mRNA interferase MazF